MELSWETNVTKCQDNSLKRKCAQFSTLFNRGVEPRFQVCCALHSVKITVKEGGKLDANFSSAAMAHTFSRLAAMDKCCKNSIFVCHQSHVVRSYKCFFEKLGSAKMAKHWKSKKKGSVSIWCTGTTNRLVNFVFPNSTKSQETWVALELWLLRKGMVSFQLENDCMNWCLLIVCHPAKILKSQILDNQLSSFKILFSPMSPLMLNL